jgi:Tol biopolymer transport system component
VYKLIRYISPILLLAFSACATGDRDSGDYRIAFVPDLSGQHGIFALNSDRTGGRLLTPEASAQLRASSWSPDGKKIAFFASRDEDADIRAKYRTPYQFPLYVMNAAGGNLKRLLDFPVSSFAWSPDSRKMLFVSAYEDPARNDEEIVKGFKNPLSAVYILDLDTGTQQRVTGFGQNCYGSWSPDGTMLALSFGDAQSSDIYTSSLDGKHTFRIVEKTGINVKPVWSPDGKRIAYVCFIPKPGGMTSEAWVVDAGSASRRPIGKVDPYEVFWSVNGRYVLLRTTKGFVLASPDRDGVIEMKNQVIEPQDALFTPDGKEVMFRSNHEGPWYIYAVGLDGANIRRISGNLSAASFCLSPASY